MLTGNIVYGPHEVVYNRHQRRREPIIRHLTHEWQSTGQCIYGRHEYEHHSIPVLGMAQLDPAFLSHNADYHSPACLKHDVNHTEWYVSASFLTPRIGSKNA